jgi:CAAX protease family protein
MLTRVFITTDGRPAICWRLVLAYVLWFAVAILTEEVAARRLGQAAGGLLLAIGSALLILGLRRVVDRRPAAALGLIWRPAGAAQAVSGFLLGGLAIGVVIAVTFATGGARLDGVNPSGTSVAGAAGLVLGALVLTLGFGFGEEVLFRGYFLQNLGGSLPAWAALLLTSVLFGLLHILQVHALLPLSEIALGGLLLGLLRLATGTLWAAVGFHAAWDLLQMLFGTTLLPTHAGFNAFEQTPAGYVVPLVVAAILIVVLARRRPAVDWRARLVAAGGLAEAAPDGNARAAHMG